MTINIEKLTATLPESAIEWRVQSGGFKKDKSLWALVVPYADARYLQGVLDEVCGPANWQDEYSAGPDGGVKCRLSIRFGDEWVAKENGAPNTDIEAIKGGYTAAFRRVCVNWNIAGIRCLYDVGDLFANIRDNGRLEGSCKPKGSDRREYFKYDPPRLGLPSSPAGQSAATGSGQRGPQRSAEGAKASAPSTTRSTPGLLAQTLRVYSKATTDDDRTKGMRRAKESGKFTGEELDVLGSYLFGQKNIAEGNAPEKGMSAEETINYDRAVALLGEGTKEVAA